MFFQQRIQDFINQPTFMRDMSMGLLGGLCVAQGLFQLSETGKQSSNLWSLPPAGFAYALGGKAAVLGFAVGFFIGKFLFNNSLIVGQSSQQRFRP